MDLSQSTLEEQLNAKRLELHHSIDQINPNQEAAHIISLIDHVADRLADYTDAELVAYGGSGIVLRAFSHKQQVLHAIKFPRHHVVHRPAGVESMPVVNKERQIMERISHQYIARLFEAIPLHDLQPGAEILIQTYVDKPRNLIEYATDLCCYAACLEDDQVFHRELLRLAKTLYHIADAIAYLHRDMKLLHFDIKPDNILVSGNTDNGNETERHPFLTDFGLAQPIKQDQNVVEVGFTWHYAHPDLRDSIGVHLTDVNRAKRKIESSLLAQTFDLFAFGRTIQETLAALANVHGPRAYSQYVFNYLHVTAALCLDGRNSDPPPALRGKISFVNNTPFGMGLDVFRKHRFDDFADVKRALERLLGLRRLGDELPELQSHSSSNVNVSDLGPTTLTRRVAEILNHPTFRRLHSEQQLGMIETIYPTATHTRYEHCAGVYHNACEYIRALYDDQENPTFRILFSEAQGRITLLAALLHDLGQTAFGHDMEEMEIAHTGQAPSTYDHVSLGLDLLESTALLEEGDQPLARIISRPVAEGGWGVKPDDLRRFLKGVVSLPMDSVYRAIVDGPLDADKLDYLIRDSVNCRVRYGHGIDDKRFFASLTTTTFQNGNALRMAVKRKGAASAEEILLTRYQMFQSVYWHHTFRCVKAMLVDAALLAIRDLEDGAQAKFDNKTERKAYYQFVLENRWNGKEWKTPSTKADNVVQIRLAKALSGKDRPPVHSKWADDRTLLYLWRISSPPQEEPPRCPWTVTDPDQMHAALRQWRKGKARQLLLDILRRNYYKRLLEVPIAEYTERTQLVLPSFQGVKRLDWTWKVTKAILDLAEDAIQQQQKSRLTVAELRFADGIREAAKSRIPVLLDIPPAKFWTEEGAGKGILFVDDYKRRYFRSDANMRSVSESHWNSMLPAMMKRVAHLRVFCEPNLHKILTRLVDTDQIMEAVENALGFERSRT